MMKVKRVFCVASRWRYLELGLLVAMTLGMHFSIIDQPADLMVDEIYYVNDARTIVAGEGELRPEHPPLGQLMIASGILLFGDNPFGWRIFSVAFGSLGIVFFHLVCLRLGLSRRTAFLATFLYSLENLSFVQASIAMLDVFSVTLMLCGFWLYLRRHYAFAPLAFSLGTLAKLTAGLGVAIVALHWLVQRKDQPRRFLVSLAVAPLFFVLLLPALDYLMTGELYDPIVRIREILTVSASITFTQYTNLYASRPWDWVLRPVVMPYYWDPQYVAVISFTVGALIVPTMVYMAVRARVREEVAVFSLSWFLLAYVAWIPISLISNRMSYIFYFYPAVGAVCLGLAAGISSLIAFGQRQDDRKKRRLVLASAAGYLVFHACLLILLTPLGSFWVSLQASVPAG